MKALTKAQLKEVYKKAGKDDEGTAYCLSHSSAAYKTCDGYVWNIEKPTLETSFCFGEHGYDYDDVIKECATLSKDENYFIAANIRKSKAFSLLQSVDQTQGALFWVNDYTHGNLAEVRYIRMCDMERNAGSIIRELTGEEKGELEAIAKEEIEKFKKRLNTYLKRYGLAKCHFWTYWAD